MNRILTVLKFTYVQALKTKWFIIMLLAGIILIVGVFNADTIMKSVLGEDVHPVAVCDQDGLLPAGELVREMGSDGSIKYVALQSDKADGVIQSIESAESDYSAAIIFKSGEGTTDLYLSPSISHEDTDAITTMVSSITISLKALRMNIPADTIEAIVSPKNVNIIVGEQSSGHNFMVIILIVVLFMIILLYGSMISNSVVEEKNNRIMETLICAANPQALLFGKVFGMFAVSMTQIAVWGVLGLVLAQIQPLDNSIISMISGGTQAFVLMVVFTLLGYLMYAMVFGALGSLADNSQDATQLMLPISLILMLVYIAATLAMDNPNSPLIVALTYIPFSAPVITFARAIVTDLPLTELVLSIVLQVIYIIGIGLLSSYIYKKGVVSYGVISKIFSAKPDVKKA